MSIQPKTYKNKNGKEITKYYPCVWDSINKKPVYGDTGYSTEIKALVAEEKLKEKVKNGKIPKTKSKFKEVACKWFEARIVLVKNKELSNNTYRTDKDYYNSYLSDIFDDVYCHKITSVNIKKFVDEMKKEYKPKTVNRALSVLNMIFEYAVFPERVITDNPCLGIKGASLKKREFKVWDTETISYFMSLGSVKTSRYYEMFAMSFGYGMRPGEVCGLNASDLLGKGILKLKRGYDKYSQETYMKTDDSHRSLVVLPFYENLLLRRIEMKKYDKLECISKDITYFDNDYIFTQKNGNPVNPDVYYKAFKRIIAKHNKELELLADGFGKLPDGNSFLPDIRLYDARHSFGTNMILVNDKSPAIVAEIMGSSVEMIMKNYVHPNKIMQKDTLSGYADKLFRNEVSSSNTGS
ncbi:tyrosine-type recombinase/integrase [Diplocloster modestus]|uniref:Tyrosine-type recombinase/integrase n=1 Tax=Diplocloster modestus TaxID=2850322 RepID=A0ABS6K7B5_9FIRM|nr:tyrosine-type recombinase/integrase [Diplocloster modestus]MBU9726402.1 tyrosine-type recombinase/integrase [Diplocloster modestus]